MTSPAAAVVPVLVTAAVMFFGGCRAATPAVAPTLAPAPTASATVVPASPGSALPPAALEEARISGAAGDVRWDLAASSVEVNAAEGQATLTAVTARFYERGALVLTLSAPRAVYRTASRDVVLSGGVRARGAQGRALDAARVEWVAGRRLIIATGSVRYVQEQMTVHADRLESDVALRKTRLTGRIRVTVRGEP